MSKQYRIAKLVNTVLAIRPAYDEVDEINFRIDVFVRPDGDYSCQVWRLDMYRLKPMPQDDPEHEQLVADEQVMILEHCFNWWDLRGRTPDELLAMVFDAIDRQLGVRFVADGGSRE
jgi:hypothetical protein